MRNPDRNIERYKQELEYIYTLKLGINPRTGELLSLDDVAMDPLFREILKEAEKRLNYLVRKRERGVERAGEPWDTLEEQDLLNEYRAGKSIDEIAKIHGRTTGAIISRLEMIDSAFSSAWRGLRDSGTEAESAKKDYNIDTSEVKPIDHAAEQPEHCVTESCKNCMLMKREECLGENSICEFYQHSPSISKEEMNNWPKYGDATSFRLSGKIPPYK